MHRTQLNTDTSLLFIFLQMKSLVLAALVASASAFVPSRPMAARATSSLQMADSVEERVRELVKSQLNPDGDFADSASFMDDLGADSLDAVELIMSLEEEFEIEIPDDEVEGITTVQAAIDFVKSKQ
jgi:acyl carrier protein